MGHASDLHVEMMEEEEKLKNLCPKCGEGYMYSDDVGDMTDGQMSEWLAGHNHLFSCENCGHQEERNVEMYEEIPEDYFFKYDDEINADVIEDLIERAIKKRSFIEVLSLIHNVIELYLMHKIRQYIFSQNNLDELGFDKDRRGVNDKGFEFINDSKEKTANEKRAIKRIEGIFNPKKRIYLYNYKELCFKLKLIDAQLNKKIEDFNEDRNKAIHQLLKKDESKKSQGMKYSDIKDCAILGREIQLILSPIEHSKEDIINILKDFKITEEEAKSDKFLRV